MGKFQKKKKVDLQHWWRVTSARDELVVEGGRQQIVAGGREGKSRE